MRFTLSLIAIVAVFLFCLGGTASADILDDMDSTFFTGIIVGGEAQTILEGTTIFTPEGQSFLGIPMDWAEFKLVQFGSFNYGKDGEIDVIGDSTQLLSEFTYAGRLWDSDTFFLSIKHLDEPYNRWGGGLLYDWRHWNQELPPILFGAYVLESGKMFFTMKGDWQFDYGYYLGCDVQIAMDTPNNRDWLDGKIYLKHNLKPTGDYYAEVGVRNLWGTNYVYGGIGGLL